MCVCVCERETETQRERETETERQRKRENAESLLHMNKKYIKNQPFYCIQHYCILREYPDI